MTRRGLILTISLISVAVVLALFQSCGYVLPPRDGSDEISSRGAGNGEAYTGIHLDYPMLMSPGQKVTIVASNGEGPYTFSVESGPAVIEAIYNDRIVIRANNSSVQDQEVVVSVTDQVKARASASILIVEFTSRDFRSIDGPRFGQVMKRLGDEVYINSTTVDEFSGRVHLLKREDDLWDNYRTIVSPVIEPFSSMHRYNDFSHSYDSHGEWLIVGNPRQDIWGRTDGEGARTTEDSGEAIIYKRNSVSGQWAYRQRVFAPHMTVYNGMRFSTSVQINDRWAAVSSVPANEDVSKDQVSRVYLFLRQGEVWTLYQILSSKNEHTEFGQNLQFVGDDLVVKAKRRTPKGQVAPADTIDLLLYRFNSALNIFELKNSYNSGLQADSGFADQMTQAGGQVFVSCGGCPVSELLGNDELAGFSATTLRAGGYFGFKFTASGIELNSAVGGDVQALGESNSAFGYRMSAQGDLLAVSAPCLGYTQETCEGTVFIYRLLPDGSRKELVSIQLPNAGPNERFGENLVLFGETLFVKTRDTARLFIVDLKPVLRSSAR
ncbi:MAG: hypothetical protein H6624_04810 [Bdellovibrionaceae bacterium]|nr:hypothetical protein [Bdellovibrionales bacterium]MCB9083639.1 hypothetical protein [Pseudobdellovibrionaceae bacterium]